MASASRRRRPGPARTSPQERAAKVEALLAQLNSAVGELTEGEQWTAMLRAATKFHRYSFRNMMLLWAQAEQRGITLSAVAGFSAWKALGRSVRKGERGLQILAPVTRRTTDEHDDPVDGDTAGPRPEEKGGRRVVAGFRVAHVFDVSQTDGAPLPEPPRPVPLAGADTTALWEPLANLVRAAGFALQRRPETGQAQGWTDYVNRVVAVRPDIDDAYAVAVLAHELGHIRAGHEHRKIGRAQAETEAESIAFIVMAAHGGDSTSSAVPYVAGWSGGDREVIAAAAETVHTAAAGILADLAPDEPPQDPATGAPAPTRRAAPAAQAGRPLGAAGGRAAPEPSP
ncbi:ArdC-like ssDNA-binding domain-containing protein [Pseudonocardia lacus]|uniref:ArdC-like ssDNA-binding domain-containing protein n=1 Tax=Pseudonocardia lacus TaxID=2835865 RepID=UPI001BDBFD41|nr:ArdC-like ssDNA-binding domain-containing protein [Pseudonocardia lacus]